MKITKPSAVQFDQLQQFYYKLIDEMQDAPVKPGWQKGIYPSDAFIRQSLENEDFFIAKENEQIAAAMVINHETNDGYPDTIWSVKAKPEEVLVIHALGVMPDFQNQGLAKEMVKAALQEAEKQNCKAIRLDVLYGNMPAKKLYESMGFVLCGTACMFYEDTGWTDFWLYELEL